MSLPTHPAERHRQLAARFTELTEGVRDWDVPTPVAEWDARGVVQHLVEWLPGLLASGSDLRIGAVPSVAEDPVAAWRAVADAVQSILDDPDSSTLPFTSQMMPEMTVGQMLSQFWTPDVFLHAWDLAVATEQDDRLDPELSLELLDGFRTVEPMLRESGQFGVQQPVADDATVQAKLIAFIGRDPEWAPPAR